MHYILFVKKKEIFELLINSKYLQESAIDAHMNMSRHLKDNQWFIP
mgnify:CR=1 FL=1